MEFLALLSSFPVFGGIKTNFEISKKFRQIKAVNSKFKMGTMLYNKEPMALVYNMDYYFQQKPPDCSLYSRDGCEFPVHKELFSQTKFMRKIVKNFSFDQCNFDACCKMEILLPSLTKKN